MCQNEKGTLTLRAYTLRQKKIRVRADSLLLENPLGRTRCMLLAWVDLCNVHAFVSKIIRLTSNDNKGKG